MLVPWLGYFLSWILTTTMEQAQAGQLENKRSHGRSQPGSPDESQPISSSRGVWLTYTLL